MGAAALEQKIFAARALFGWTLFTLTAGLVNASAVFACRSFVSHVTGNITNLGVDASNATPYLFIALLFFVGAMFSVFVAETLKSNPTLGYALPILLSLVLLVGIAVVGKSGYFGTYGGDEELGSRAVTMVGILATSMGMINAAIAAATANQIRVSHLTGPTTDLAGNVVRAALDSGQGSRIELRWATLRFAKIASFAVGAAIAARFATALKYDAFVVAAGILVVALAFTASPPEKAARSTQDDAPRNAEISGEHPVLPERMEDGMPPLPGPSSQASERPRAQIR